MKKNSGFTLIEMLIAIAIAAILLAVGVPSFNQIIRDNRATTQTNEVATALAIARSEALRRARSVSVCPSTNNTSCSGSNWAVGWIVVLDGNNSGAPNVSEVLRAFSAMNGSTTPVAPTHIRYLSSGMLNATAVQTIDVRPEGCAGTERRSISISTTGRVSVTRIAC